MVKKLAEQFTQMGYRFCPSKPEEVGIYYKFYQEGFHVCLVVDCEHGFTLTPDAHQKIVENTMNLFYHPEGRLQGFPQGLPVYHVEVMTIVVGTDSNLLHELCANCRNTWAIAATEQKLLIYENQPGDFFGLRANLERLIYGDTQTSPYTSEPSQGYTNPQKGIRSWIESLKATDIRRMPYFTIAIVALNVLVFLIMELFGSTTDAEYVAYYGGMYPPYVLYGNQWWRILTSMFIHFGAAHLLNNMVIFACVGSRLEPAMGHMKFIALYLFSGIGGGLLSLFTMIHQNSFAVSAGASGAVFGVIGGLLWVVIRHRGRFDGLTQRGMILMIVLCLYYGFVTAGVDNFCHIGGLIVGFLFSALFYRRKPQKD